MDKKDCFDIFGTMRGWKCWFFLVEGAKYTWHPHQLLISLDQSHSARIPTHSLKFTESSAILFRAIYKLIKLTVSWNIMLSCCWRSHQFAHLTFASWHGKVLYHWHYYSVCIAWPATLIAALTLHHNSSSKMVEFVSPPADESTPDSICSGFKPTATKCYNYHVAVSIVGMWVKGP